MKRSIIFLATAVSALSSGVGASCTRKVEEPLPRELESPVVSAGTVQPSPSTASPAPSASATAAGSGAATSAGVASAAVSVDASPAAAKRLMGRWLRRDGDYVIQVKAVGARDEVKVEYFNPGRIRVEAATLSRVGPELRLMVRLRDKGYSGSTYQLAYDGQTDSLRGQYFMGGTGQQYTIEFQRQPAPRVP